MTLTRRRLLGTIGAATAASALPGLPALAQDRSIRHFWWGNPTRDKNTFAVIEIFQGNHPEIAVSGETIGWGDYWTKMATQTAGGNMADVVQMDHGFINEYVSRGALRSMDDLVGDKIDISHYDDGANAVGTIDGSLYGISIGATSQAIPYNRKVYEDAGVEFDPLGWTTEDFAAACARITEATGGGVTGSEDLSLYIENFEVWVRQAGHDLYTADGKIGATPEDVASYWAFWKDLRDAGVIEGKDQTVILDKGMAELGIVKGSTAATFRYANQVGAVQSLMVDPVGAAMVPQREGMAHGHFVLPSMFLSITRDVKDLDAAAMYINDWINTPEAIVALGLDRGIPPSETGRAALAPSLSETETAVVEYFGAIQPKIGPRPTAKPKGAGEVRDAFMRIGTEVVLGNLSPEDGAEQFTGDAEAILFRANR